MKKTVLFAVILAFSMSVSAKESLSDKGAVSSPDGRISMQFNSDATTVCYDGKPVLTLASMGSGAPVFVRTIDTDYRMVSGKRLHCTNKANEYKLEGRVEGNGSERYDIVVRLYNDGLAYRYEAPGLQLSAFNNQSSVLIPEGTKRWMQQWCDSYEGFFPLSTTYKVEPVPSYSGISKSAEGWNNRWGYPALLEPRDGVFVLLTEANIEPGQSASCLYNDAEVFRVVAASAKTPMESMEGDGGASAKTPMKCTPWRVAIIGALGDVVESTLVTDVSEACKLDDTSWIKPGVVSWIYWAYNHGSNDYSIICKYVDLAVALKLPYVLIDAEWDEMGKVAANEGKTIEDALAYAREKGIKPLIWYNSSVGWVDGAPTPKYRLNKPEDREKEFAWCEKMGVAGVKIDFFSGDTQLNMDYCQELLESAARHHLLVNFHGATVPRGWQRTWPNLMSTEGVYGAEWYNNVPTFTSRAACHNATLPFTRNVIGPMDYTPCAFSDSQHLHITTHAHELALTVLFESGLQHLADRPESFLAQPQEVKDFLGQLPAAWDDTRYVSGYPGESVVLARRSGSSWYVAGINGTDEKRSLDLSTLPAIVGQHNSIVAFQDSGSKEQPWSIGSLGQLPTAMECLPRGGFILIVK